MGACNSTKEVIFKDKSPEKDFEYYRQLITRDNNYEIKAKLWQVNNINGKVKYKLLSKYLFMKPNGEFDSKIKTPSTGEEVTIEGKLEKIKKIKFSYKDKLPDKDEVNQINFDGEIKITEYRMYSTLQAEILNHKMNGEYSCMYILNFPKKVWNVQNTLGPSSKIFNAFLDFDEEDLAVRGISYDDRGFSLWAGLGKNPPNITLVQYYIGNSVENEEDNIVSYVGEYDRVLGFTISGSATNTQYPHSGTFQIKRNDALKGK
jgi:hypothetical protein